MVENAELACLSRWTGRIVIAVVIATQALRPVGRCRVICLLLPLLVEGCGALLSAGTADVAGIASAGIAHGVGASPAAATAIGLGVAAGANAGLQLVERKVHGAEQDQIAAAAGGLKPGAVGTWHVEHDLPIEPDRHGQLVVTRLLGAAEFACKEIVFSVDEVQAERRSRAFYTATVCRDGDVWKWAAAEPATSRWGALQ